MEKKPKRYSDEFPPQERVADGCEKVKLAQLEGSDVVIKKLSAPIPYEDGFFYVARIGNIADGAALCDADKALSFSGKVLTEQAEKMRDFLPLTVTVGQQESKKGNNYWIFR